MTMSFKGNQHAAGDPPPNARKERTSKIRKAAGGPGVDEKLNREVRKGRQEYNVGSGKKCSNCGGTVAAGRKSCQNCGSSFGTLADRISELESAVISLASMEFGGDGSGENEGHPFRGNQWSGEGGSKEDKPEKEKKGLFGKLKEARAKMKAENERWDSMTDDERRAEIEKNNAVPAKKTDDDFLKYMPGSRGAATRGMREGGK